MTGAANPKPVLMRADEILNIKRAASHARRNEKTIRIWVRQYGIGRQSCAGGPVEVSRIALDMVLHGDMDALEKLREGERGDPDVARYFNFAGLPIR